MPADDEETSTKWATVCKQARKKNRAVHARGSAATWDDEDLAGISMPPPLKRRYWARFQAAASAWGMEGEKVLMAPFASGRGRLQRSAAERRDARTRMENVWVAMWVHRNPPRRERDRACMDSSRFVIPIDCHTGILTNFVSLSCMMYPSDRPERLCCKKVPEGSFA